MVDRESMSGRDNAVLAAIDAVAQGRLRREGKKECEQLTVFNQSYRSVCVREAVKNLSLSLSLTPVFCFAQQLSNFFFTFSGSGPVGLFSQSQIRRWIQAMLFLGHREVKEL